MATTTFKLGDMVVHRIIEMECGFTPALEFLPKLTPADAGRKPVVDEIAAGAG